MQALLLGPEGAPVFRHERVAVRVGVELALLQARERALVALLRLPALGHRVPEYAQRPALVEHIGLHQDHELDRRPGVAQALARLVLLHQLPHARGKAGVIAVAQQVLAGDRAAEAVVPDIVGFMNYSLYNQVYRHRHLGAKAGAEVFAEVLLRLIKQAQKPMDEALRASKHFEGITPWDEVVAGAKPVLSLGNMTGEGWFLPGEMVELLRSGVNNIVCMQPFGCLPNHIVGKGMLKELRRQYKGANLMPIDYDPGASVVNQLNRIRLMMATAKKRVAEEQGSARPVTIAATAAL